MTSILGPSGSPIVDLGGDHAWRQRVHGDIVCTYQWIDLRAQGDPTADKDQPEPCMVLHHAARMRLGGAYVTPARNAWAFVRSDGRPTEHLIASAAEGAEAMGFSRDDRHAIFKIVGIIVDGLDDLREMPSSPPKALQYERASRGIAATIKRNGETVHQEVI